MESASDNGFPRGGSLLLTLDSENKLMDTDDGGPDDGFLRRYIRGRVDAVRALAGIPDHRIVRYLYDDPRSLPLPVQMEGGNEAFLARVAQLENEGLERERTIHLLDAVYCADNNIDPLSKRGSREALENDPRYEFYCHINDQGERIMYSLMDEYSRYERLYEENHYNSDTPLPSLPQVHLKEPHRFKNRPEKQEAPIPEADEICLTITPDRRILYMGIGCSLPEFAGRNVEAVKQNGFTTDNCMVRYHLPDREFLRRVADDAGVLAGELLPALVESGIRPAEMMTVMEALRMDVMLQNPCDPEEPEWGGYLREGFQEVEDYGLCMKERPFHDLVAVETEKGVRLFSKDERGERLKTGYLQGIADNFFDPEPGISRLTLHHVADLPGKYTQLVNIPDYAGKDVLDYSDVVKRYDMAPTTENLRRFIDGNDWENVPVPADTRDIMHLLHIRDEGYAGTGFDGGFPNPFSHTGEFEQIVKNAPDKKSCESLTKARAAEILAEKYPNIRKTESRAVLQPSGQEQVRMAPERPKKEQTRKTEAPKPVQKRKMKF